MGVEESSRDATSRHNGFALRAVPFKAADRIDHLLLIVSVYQKPVRAVSASERCFPRSFTNCSLPAGRQA